MFTGIVENIGLIKKISKRGGSNYITIGNTFDELLEIGSSVAMDGVCLTVIECTLDSFQVEISPETFEKTTVKYYKVGYPVNLERAVKYGNRMDGHFLLGHIDSVGRISKLQSVNERTEIKVDYPNEFDPLVVYKGSVAVNGISLTIAKKERSTFSVAIIEHTYTNTTLKLLRAGSLVNLEFDIILKGVNTFNRRSDVKKRNPISFY